LKTRSIQKGHRNNDEREKIMTNWKKRIKKLKAKLCKKFKINLKKAMNITQLLITEADGTETVSTTSTPIVKVIATLEDGSAVTVFPVEGAPVPTPEEPETIAVPLGTPVKLVSR